MWAAHLICKQCAREANVTAFDEWPEGDSPTKRKWRIVCPLGLWRLKERIPVYFSVGYQLYDSFSLCLTSSINCYTFLMCDLKIGSMNLHSKWSWVCAVHPGGTEMGFFYLLFPQKICWSVPRIDGDKMIWLKMKRKEKRCWGQIKFHTKSIKPKHKFVNSDLILTYAKLGLINRKQKQIRP